MEMNFWTLHGRNWELQLIAERITGAEPRSVVVAGPGEVSKTRPAREALAAAKRSGRVPRWAVGTSAATTIPLGAVAHSLPALGTSSGTLTLLQRAGVAIADQAEGHWLVLVIDDAHLLDGLAETVIGGPRCQ